MNLLEERWQQDDIQSFLQSSRRCVVAFSGGADSLSLLSLATSLSKPILALHVNHGLNTDADEWQQICIKQCLDLGVRLECFKVKVDRKGSIEENARKARYSVFENFLQEKDLLLLAHHADDQIETVLFNLFRGTSIPGIVAMPRSRGLGKAKLFRPFLDVPRANIIAYCKLKGFKWIDDSSNQDKTFDRSYLRHGVVPLIEDRWPNFRSTVLQGISRDGEMRELIRGIAENDLMECRSGLGLAVSAVLKLPNTRKDYLFRCWITKEGFPFPTMGILRAMHKNLLMAKPDAEPCVSWRGCEIRRYKDNLILKAQSNLVMPKKLFHFNPLTSLTIAGGLLRTVKEEGNGLKFSGLERDLVIKFRQGGESIRVNGKTKIVKKLLQDLGVPPWLRNRLPLIYRDDVLVAIPGIPEWNTLPITVSEQLAKSGESGLLFWFDNTQ
ncbi:MAG: tRNA lysidine(34) synthetase TilS [Gammaproteobacteria bacterium]|nr:tRNA lysidine(34) synthetase TilS [Gammaproteobacteria bacterium]OUV68053.1 MAG: tRNA lysidine(34) synthetase TilS [Gammaproteobacteria bacterium TMED133]